MHTLLRVILAGGIALTVTAAVTSFARSDVTIQEWQIVMDDPTAPNDPWIFAIRGPDGSPRTVTFDTKGACEKFLTTNPVASITFARLRAQLPDRVSGDPKCVPQVPKGGNPA